MLKIAQLSPHGYPTSQPINKTDNISDYVSLFK